MKTLSTILVIALLSFCMKSTASADFAEQKSVTAEIHQEAVRLLEMGYEEYYNINGSSATLICRTENNGIIEESFLLELNATLKASSVLELDYYQGVMDYQQKRLANLQTPSQDTDKADLKGSDDYFTAYSAMISEKVLDVYNNFEQYIGAEQILAFYVMTQYDAKDLGTAVILFENGAAYATVEAIYPPSRDELRKNGYDSLEATDKSIIEANINDGEQGGATRGVWSVYNGVMYTNSYTSNPTNCNVHGNTCGNLVNTTKYNNSSYRHWVTGNAHTDCANFISQALHAGGIPKDSTWTCNTSTGTSAWINVSALTSYMFSNKHYWSPIPTSAVAVGDIMSYGSYSHIVMITAHDGVSFRYSGHTNDRLNIVTGLSSSDTFYRVTY